MAVVRYLQDNYSLPNSPNGGSTSRIYFSILGSHWNVIVESLWFAIYKTVIAYLINQMVVPPLGYISLYKAATGM